MIEVTICTKIIQINLDDIAFISQCLYNLYIIVTFTVVSCEAKFIRYNAKLQRKNSKAVPSQENG